MLSRVHQFYTNDLTGHPDGHTIDTVLSWSDDELEKGHNWVQWAFPTIEGSLYQPDAPTLHERDIVRLKNSPVTQAKMKAMMWRMVDFYDRTLTWLNPHDHNHLRITRIIKSLSLILPPPYAAAFYHFIMWKVTTSSRGVRVNSITLAMWRHEGEQLFLIVGGPPMRPTENARGVTENALGVGVRSAGSPSDEIQAQQAGAQEKKGAV